MKTFAKFMIGFCLVMAIVCIGFLINEPERWIVWTCLTGNFLLNALTLFINYKRT